jgi:hypothetical protein
MKNILIIYPHWPPSNLAGVHRPRLIANFLPEFGWHPIVLTVNPSFYEEKPDWDMLKTVREDIEVHYVDARKVGKLRIIGDIGLRAFCQLKIKALQLIREKKIDFIWIPIPSFYTAILGRKLHDKTSVPYGIDYIDPWVRDISNRKNVRSILSLLIARILEPYSIKKAALISGVAEAYFKPALNRNFKNKTPVQVAMPYGFDPSDHQIKLEKIDYPWDKFPSCIPYIYAGAFLPNSGLFIDLLFKSINMLKSEGKFDSRIKLFFVGTGNYQHKSITEYADENFVSEHIIEIRERYPFLHVLNFLSAAKGVVLIGSTEKHYTASKTFQSILSGKPVFSILHAESTAVDVFKECGADNWLVEYSENKEMEKFLIEIKEKLRNFVNQQKVYQPNIDMLDKYSSKQSAKDLVDNIEKYIVNPLF